MTRGSKQVRRLRHASRVVQNPPSDEASRVEKRAHSGMTRFTIRGRVSNTWSARITGYVVLSVYNNSQRRSVGLVEVSKSCLRGSAEEALWAKLRKPKTIADIIVFATTTFGRLPLRGEPY